MSRIIRGTSSAGSRVIKAGDQSTNAEAMKVLIEAKASRDRVADDLQGQVQRLAIGVANKILGEELALNPARIADVVAEAIDRVKRAKELVVVVHPADAELVRAKADTISARADRPAPFEIETDPNLKRGDCILRSSLGEVDARIETQLAAFESALAASSRT